MQFVASFDGKAVKGNTHLLDKARGFLTMYPHDFLINDSLETIHRNVLGSTLHQ